MSGYLSPYIICDYDDGSGICCEDYDGQTIGEHSDTWPEAVDQVRARAAEAGWHRLTDGRDVCPSCWKAGAR